MATEKKKTPTKTKASPRRAAAAKSERPAVKKPAARPRAAQAPAGQGFVFDEARDRRWRDQAQAALAALARRKDLELRPPPRGDALSVRWFSKDGSANGELRWVAFDPDGGDRLDVRRFFDGAPAEAALARELFIFEDHPDGGDGVMVLASSSGQLFAHYSVEQALLPLAATFAEYVELQLGVMGLDGVIGVLAAHGEPPGPASAFQSRTLRRAHKAHAARTLATARKLFPAADLSVLERAASRRPPA